MNVIDRIAEFARHLDNLATLVSSEDIRAESLRLQDEAFTLKAELMSAQDTRLAAQQTALDLREQNTQQRSRIADLEAELEQLRAFLKTKDDYEVTQPSIGSFVMTRTGVNIAEEPSPPLCHACFQKGQHAPVQAYEHYVGGYEARCTNCQARVFFGETRGAIPNSRRPK